MHNYEIIPTLREIFNKLSKKDKSLYEQVLNKIEEILSSIEDLFGDELREYRKDIASNADSFNTILLGVNAIYENIKPETYEEAAKLKLN